MPEFSFVELPLLAAAENENVEKQNLWVWKPNKLAKKTVKSYAGLPRAAELGDNSLRACHHVGEFDLFPISHHVNGLYDDIEQCI